MKRQNSGFGALGVQGWPLHPHTEPRALLLLYDKQLFQLTVPQCSLVFVNIGQDKEQPAKSQNEIKHAQTHQ